MMCNEYDLIVVGSGPGGYVAAIKAAQLGMRVGVVEKEEVGGICLNWGCIPTKALLKSAELFEAMKHAADYGISVQEVTPNFSSMIQRSRSVAKQMRQGVDYLFKKNQIPLLQGRAKLLAHNMIEVTKDDGATSTYMAKHILLATGAKARQLPHIPIDGTRIIGYREALALPERPTSMLIIGGGAIGCEFAYFYNAIGTKVIMVERMSHLLSEADLSISEYMLKAFTRQGIQVYTDSTLEQVTPNGQGGQLASIQCNGREVQESTQVILSAVGIKPNIENIGLENIGVDTKNGHIVVNADYETSCKGVYAIGDIIEGPALAHVASAEAMVCIEKMAGLHPDPLDYKNVPSCVYTQPEVASVGYTERAAREAGYKIKVGKFPFSASGKAHAVGHIEGFVKVIFDAQYGEWLGAHMVGYNVTEMISEVVVGRKLETTGDEIQNSIHPHPTMSEAIVEAVAAAYGEPIHV